MTRPPPPSDLGIVLYASYGAAGSYTDPRGNAGTVRTLTEANWIASEWFYCGSAQALALVVSGVISTGMASAVVAVERQALEPNNDGDTPGATFYPAVMLTNRCDSNASQPAASQTILKADLQRGDGTGTNQVASWVSSVALGTAAAERLDVVLRTTTDHLLSGRCRVLLKASNAPQSGDKIVIAAFAGPL